MYTQFTRTHTHTPSMLCETTKARALRGRSHVRANSDDEGGANAKTCSPPTDAQQSLAILFHPFASACV